MGHFCGLRADGDGIIETKWICNYSQAGLRANAKIEENGWIQAEILDQYGTVLRGWERANSRCQAAPDGSLRFYWGDESLTGAHGQTSTAGGTVGHVVKIRFHLYGTTLFGFDLACHEVPPLRQRDQTL